MPEPLLADLAAPPPPSASLVLTKAEREARAKSMERKAQKEALKEAKRQEHRARKEAKYQRKLARAAERAAATPEDAAAAQKAAEAAKLARKAEKKARKVAETGGLTFKERCKQEKLARQQAKAAAREIGDDAFPACYSSRFAEGCPADIDAYMKTQRIVISDGGFRPVLAFDQLVLNADVQATLKEYAAPTPVQAACWPPLLMGRDVVGIAATGSGKTMGFAVPAVQALSPQDAKKKAPSVLVLSPTRELAMQIMVQFEKFKHMRSVCIYGGVAKYDQRQAFRAGVDVVVATPGRMIDLLEEDPALFDLTQISYLVLDEADRMLDCGFEQSLKKILPFLPTQRQTVMFSATWPPAIQKLAETYLKDPVHVQVGSKDLSANAAITQIVEVVQPDDKEGRLLQLLKKYHNGKNRVLVFALYKMEASRVENRLRRANYNVGAIHGNLTQQQRSQALDQFRTGVCPLLVATDVAARGLDIPNVEVVINFTFPLTTEDYCHRIGRTGRAGAKGHAHTLFTHHDKAHSGALINVLREAKQPVPDDLMAFGTTVKKKLDPNYGAFCKDVDMSVKPTKITFGDDDSDA